ncbi:peptidylprolyl isomerase, partial [Candidatus Pelagibacter sp.]|nr:peptidylprolyl isomerase [Candidatus Pelagibacter sp.]
MKRFLFLICILIFPHLTNLNAIENKIEFKIDNEIITTIDIIKELNFLAALNPGILKLNKDKIFEVSKNSIIKEKIKMIEILKFTQKIELEDKYLKKLIKNSYMKINLGSEDEFLKHLAKYNLELNDFKKKITVEALWNQIIFSKFNSKINIDIKKIKNEIINDKNNKITKFNLSEIIFDIEENQNLNVKFDQIKNDISVNGFENAAMIHSISETANIGGKLGWINKNSINQKLNKKIADLNVGEFTKPMVIPGGFLIVKLNELKEVDRDMNIDKEIKKQITIKTDQQL